MSFFLNGREKNPTDSFLFSIWSGAAVLVPDLVSAPRCLSAESPPNSLAPAGLISGAAITALARAVISDNGGHFLGFPQS